MTTQHEHLAEATIDIISGLRHISRVAQEREPNLLKRFVLACDMCRRNGADFSGNWETDPSPLQQVVTAMSDRVRHVSFDHAAGLMTLYPEAVAQNSVMIPIDWFDTALMMVDSEWGTQYYPYESERQTEQAQ